MLVAEPLSDPARLAARAILCALPAVLCLAPPAPAAEFLKTILLLYTDAPVLPILIPADRGLRSALEPSVPGVIHCYTEYLDLSQFAGGRHEQQLTRVLRQKHADRKLDLLSDGRGRRITAPEALSLTGLLGGRHLGTGVPAREGSADEHRAYPEPAVWELDRW